MIFLLHADDEPAQMLLDGRLFVIPPHEPFEVPEIRGTDNNNNGPYEYIIPDHLVAAKMREHGWYHGLVEIEMRKDNGKILVDVDSARHAAAEALRLAQDRILAEYVTEQQTRIKQGHAALPPMGRVATILERRSIDLKEEFNIDPPGWRLARRADRDAEMADLRAQIDEMRRLFLKPNGNTEDAEPAGKRKH